MCRSRGALCWFVAAVVVASCGDDERAPPTARRDLGADVVDARVRMDAADEDAVAEEAGADTGGGDGGRDCEPRCPAGATCTDGACACPEARVACEAEGGGEVCVDTATSVLHCGGCGLRCPTTFDCVAGDCVCAADRTSCVGAGGETRCADLETDAQHCGGCGNTCAPGEGCFVGVCGDTCTAGGACTSDADCSRAGAPAMIPTRGGALCLTETSEAVSEGGATWTESRFVGGYCLSGAGTEGSPGTCNPGNDDGCDACSNCVLARVDPVAGEIFGCFRRCDPTAGDWRATRSGCRPGYRCALEDGVCLPGCTTDDECRAVWRDDDEDGSHDPGETTYDASSTAHCDPATGRCVDLPFTEGATIGSSCEADRDCGQDETCELDYPGGYCTRIACTLTGRECPDDALCHPSAINYLGACLTRCTLGDETDPASVMGAGAGDPDCGRPGYACLALSGSAMGGCREGNYNAVTEPNVGQACRNDDDCWSPYGLGDCRARHGVRYCTVTSCDALPFASDGETGSTLCPLGTFCAFDSPAQCLVVCDPAAAGSDCPADYRCRPTGSGVSVCYPRCHTDAECGEGETCTDGTCSDE